MIGIRDLQGTYHLDPAHCSVGWVARHAGIAKVRGTFQEFHGWANINRDEPAKSEMLVTIAANSIYSRDNNRDQHLMAEDFLDVERFPNITFVGRDFTIQGDDRVDVTGDLTIRDVTRSITIPFEFDGASLDPFGNERVGFTGAVPVQRSDFGLTWGPTLETGGLLVGDKVQLEFEVSAVKAAMDIDAEGKPLNSEQDQPKRNAHISVFGEPPAAPRRASMDS